MKGRTFIIPFVCAALVVGCGKTGSETPISTGAGKDAKDSKAAPAVASLKELKTETVTPGKGYAAKNGDMLTMLYQGKLANGRVFDGNMDDSQVATPGKYPFALNLGMGMVIPGWDKGLVGIKVGEVRKLSIPSAMAYGAQASGDIPPNSDLFFTVKCLDILKKGEELIIDTTDVKVGTGTAVKSGDKVTVHYVGRLLNDKQFDSSRDRKDPFVFTVGNGEVVPGFDKGVQGMKKGGIRKVRIPPQAAYGANPTGGIPANSVLVFEIEVLKINGK